MTFEYMDSEDIIGNIKYNKIWLTKDKYIFRANLGNHWYLKKFIVLYKYFLVDRKKITIETIREIADNFTNFVKSIKDEEIKKEAENFFFGPIDFRNPNNLIDFEKFNDLVELDDAARKYYLVYLMKIGMQSGIKKGIGNLLYSNKNITISKILKKIPQIKKNEIKKKEVEDKTVRSVNDSTKTIFSDFHAEIRNYRQLLSYRGILPPMEDGYELNEVAKLICSADSKLIMSIWEHQKIKLRYSNPYTRVIRSDDPINKYKTKEDFEDFSTNPYLALISVMYDLFNKDSNEGYLSFEDYKYFICREAPFDLDEVVNKIISFRKLSNDEKEKIKKIFDARPKTREFSMQIKKQSSEDFLKELSNFIYGIYEYQFTSDKSYYNNMLKYENKKVTINNPEIFEIFAKMLFNLKGWIGNKYKEDYERMSNYNSLKLIDEISSDENLSEEYRKKLKKIREEFLHKYGDNLSDFYGTTLNIWKRYISYVDYELLLISHCLIIFLDNSQKIMEGEEILEEDLFLSQELQDIIGLEKNDLIEVLKKLLKIISNKEDKEKIIEVFDTLKSKNEEINKEEIEVWLENQLKNNSYSVIKQKLRKEENDLRYVLRGGRHERKRKTAMMLLVAKERINKKIIMGEYLPNYKVNNCDVCQARFTKGEPECHHIIPFEIYGPDINYNYAYLCKKCHKMFTHRTRSNEKKDAILKLKLNGIFNRAHVEKMINEGLIQKLHLDFLHLQGFLHIVDKIELSKLISAVKINLEELDDFIKKTEPSTKRWNRAMRIVFWYRIKYGLFMERIRSDLERNKCDTCNKTFAKGEPECHHIIPKRILGPESPFNYAYLCIECHKSFTHNRENKDELINVLKSKGLVSYDTLIQMIANKEISSNHLDFLLKEKFIDAEMHDHLSKVMIK